MKVRNAGKFGVIQDLAPWELPPEAWSSGQNIRMVDGAVEKFLGSSSAGLATPTNPPIYLLPFSDDINLFWIYAAISSGSTVGEVHVTDGATHKEITSVSGDYTGDLDNIWTGLVFGGIPIMNNGVEAPQSWDGDFATPTKFVDLANWPANTTCKSMRGFKNFLIALNITKSGVEFPRMVKWSTSAGNNAVPTSWDETDAAKDAGEFELQDTTGSLLDGFASKELFYLYKDDAIWAMQFIGAPLIWRFFKITGQIGGISTRCMVDTPLGQVVFGTDDIILVNGTQITSLIDRKNRKAIYANIDGTNFGRSYVVHNWAKSEVWCCFPVTDSSIPDKAFILNYRTGACSFRDIPDVMDMQYGLADPAVTPVGEDWDSDSAAWDTDSSVWNEKLFSATSRRLVGAGNTNTKLYIFDDTNQEDGVNIDSFIERTGIGSEDQTLVKHASQLFPLMESSGPVNIQVGSQMTADEAIDWSSPVSFDPNTDHKVDIRKTGRLFALKIQSDTNISWRLNGYNMPLKIVGRQ